MPLPDLPLPGKPPLDGRGSFRFSFLSAMVYPRNERKRGDWLAAAMSQLYRGLEEAGESADVLAGFHSWLGPIASLPLAPRRIYEDGIKQTSQGVLSGITLFYLLMLAEHHPARTTVEQAKALTVEFAPQGDSSVSESTVTKAWATFKDVSHLWLAFREHERRDEWSDVVWLEILAQAEWYRSAAESRRLLRSDATWKAPEALFYAQEPRRTEIPCLGKTYLSFLESQFP